MLDRRPHWSETLRARLPTARASRGGSGRAAWAWLPRSAPPARGVSCRCAPARAAAASGGAAARRRPEVRRRLAAPQDTHALARTLTHTHTAGDPWLVAPRDGASPRGRRWRADVRHFLVLARRRRDLPLCWHACRALQTSAWRTRRSSSARSHPRRWMRTRRGARARAQTRGAAAAVTRARAVRRPPRPSRSRTSLSRAGCNCRGRNRCEGGGGYCPPHDPGSACTRCRAVRSGSSA